MVFIPLQRMKRALRLSPDEEDVVGHYAERLLQNPVAGVMFLPEALKRIVEIQASQSGDSSLNPCTLGCLMDLVGEEYVGLDRDTRRSILRTYTACLDGVCQTDAQTAVSFLEAPWLFAEVVIQRPWYMPPDEEYAQAARRANNWPSLQRQLDDTRNAFLLARAIAQRGWLPARRALYESQPVLMDFAKDGIAALIHEEATLLVSAGIPLELGIQRALNQYDPFLHCSLRDRIDAQWWAKLDD